MILGTIFLRLTAAAVVLAALSALGACAGSDEFADDAGDGSGLRVVRRTPDEFCRGTARSIAVERYGMKARGMLLAKALEANGGVAVIDAVTRSVYAGNVTTESQAAEAGTAACQAYFR